MIHDLLTSSSNKVLLESAIRDMIGAELHDVVQNDLDILLQSAKVNFQLCITGLGLSPHEKNLFVINRKIALKVFEQYEFRHEKMFLESERGFDNNENVATNDESKQETYIYHRGRTEVVLEGRNHTIDFEKTTLTFDDAIEKNETPRQRFHYQDTKD